MPCFDIIKKTKVENTFRNATVLGKYDIPKTEEKIFQINGNIDLVNDWQIGLIYGTSGSGKSIIAKEIFGGNIIESYKWDNKKSLIDNFDNNLSMDEITTALSSVGFNSIPSWLQPFNTLSNGQQFRATLARAITENDTICFDEFTSVVDRTVAKSVCVSLRKYIKRTEKKFIGISCHSDILEWLQPDWTFETDTKRFARDCLWQPKISIKITKGDVSYWKYFARNHYMTSDISHTAKVYLLWISFDEKEYNLAGFFSTMPAMGMKGWDRGHRTVILPDYQGLGLGNKFIEMVAQWLWETKKRKFRATTSAIGIIKHRLKNKHIWKCVQKPIMKPASGTGIKTSVGRLISSWVYIPKK
jgi:GNAT superfamily N-acetyltransferase